MPESYARRTVAFVSLGCPKNLVDSERLVSTLLSRGFRVLDRPDDADLVLVNTCGFLEASRAESVAAIREAVASRNEGQHRGVLVAGCMVGNYKDQIEREAPGVDRFVPFSDYEQIDRIADELLPEVARPDFTVERRRIDAALTPGHYAYLKISEGCNHTCAFCVIPEIRGPMRSVGLEDLEARARQLVQRGVRELTLIAQDSTVYGTDLYGENRLPKLLTRLDQIEELRWIRLMYAYPTEVREPLIEAMANGRRILPYLDVPIQHAATGVLKRMRRGYDRERLTRMVTDLRKAMPKIALRTTVIVGFPGETEAEFEELLAYLREVRFDRLGAFPYSAEGRSRSATMPDHLPEEVKTERWHRLMAQQREIAFEATSARVGTEEVVMVDAPANAEGRALARSFRDAPEVDAGVWLLSKEVAPGDFVPVRYTAAEGYDLIAEPLKAPPGFGV